MYGLILLGIVILFLGLSVLMAVIRGLSKSLIRFITVLASALLAVFVCLIGKSLLPNGVAFVELVNNNMTLIKQNFGAEAAETVAEILEYLKISPVLTETLVQLTGALAAPILCVILFMILGVVFWVMYLIALIIRRVVIHIRHGKKWKPSRGLAACVGLVQGLVVMAILFIPLSGYLGVAAPTMNALIQQDVLEDDEYVIQIAQDVVNDVNESFVIETYRIFGGNLLTDSMMAVKVGDVKVSLREETNTLVNLAGGVMKLSSTDMANYGSDEAKIIRTLGDSFTESKLLTPIAGDVLYAATDAWMKGEEFYGVGKPAVGGDYGAIVNPTVDALVGIVHDDAPVSDTLRSDVLTLTEMGAIVIENGLLSQLNDTAGLMSALNNEAMVTDLVTVLGENQSMKRLIPEMTNLGIRAMGHFLNIPEDTQQVYDTFLNDVTNALNSGDFSDPEQIKALSEKVGTAFDNAGIAVDDEILDLYMTGMILDLVENNPRGEVTPADVQAFFMIYSQNVQGSSMIVDEEATAMLPTFDLLSTSSEADPFAGTVYENMTEDDRKNTAAAVLANVCVIIMDMDAEAEDYSVQVNILVVEIYTEVLGEEHPAMEVIREIEVTKPLTNEQVMNAASMESPEEMKKTTTVVTMEVLLVDTQAAADNITSETLATEAAAITAIFSTAGNMAEILGSDSKEMDVQTLAGSVGTILDSLSGAGSFGEEKTANLFTAVMQSETVREAAGMDMSTATQMAGQATQGGGNYADTMGAVAGSLGLIDKVQKNESITNEEMVEFMHSLTPQSAGMFKVYISASRLVKYGVPETRAEATAEMMSAVFTYMAKDDIQDYDAEADALANAIQMALEARDSQSKQLYSSEDGTVVGKLPTAQKTVTTALSSQAIRYAILEVLTDGTQVTRRDPLGLSNSIKPNTVEYQETVAAIDEYFETTGEQDSLLYHAAFALFGLEEPAQ